eukprot:TRINITY_DN41403_c0_g2_i1.p2 TRINITY_DN41403_c0_g2~~TRINITY_DN41403_c0_g2_i1.p2  ORF type:complete len:259 (+),score=-17.82 TRINITY_DN41403_c0_g2_i1:34-777(+)
MLTYYHYYQLSQSHTNKHHSAPKKINLSKSDFHYTNTHVYHKFDSSQSTNISPLPNNVSKYNPYIQLTTYKHTVFFDSTKYHKASLSNQLKQTLKIRKIVALNQTNPSHKRQQHKQYKPNQVLLSIKLIHQYVQNLHASYQQVANRNLENRNIKKIQNSIKYNNKTLLQTQCLFQSFYIYLVIKSFPKNKLLSCRKFFQNLSVVIFNSKQIQGVLKIIQQKIDKVIYSYQLQFLIIIKNTTNQVYFN